ncbi:hypothetical protein KUV46_00120 [Thalassovita mediterranea]|nr:hypothetical protein KUV46_00120 [Thalassovita mediterranea]
MAEKSGNSPFDRVRRAISGRLVAAVLISPVLGGLVAAELVGMIFFPKEIFFVLLSDSVTYRPATPFEIFETLGSIAVVGVTLGALVGIPAMLLVGVPVHVWLVSTRRTALAYYASSGAAAGIIAGFAFGHIQDPEMWTWVFSEIYSLLVVVVVPGAVAGGIAAILFWLVSRPDKAHAE